MGRAGVSSHAGAGMAVCPPGDGLGGDDEPAEGLARETAREFFAANDGAGAQAGLAGHDAEVSLAAVGPFAHRERADPGESGAIRRGERSSYALHFHAGGLRLRLQVLCERAGRMETESAAQRNH